MLTLAAGLHGTNNTTPGIHDTLAERNDVVVHLVRALRSSSDGSRLLENLRDNGQVRLKVAGNSSGNVAEALQNSGLELVAKGLAL